MSNRGGGRGGRGQGGPNMQYGRGAFRGGRGSGMRPTPKPEFAQYSDFTASSVSYGAAQSKTDESSIIPFDIASPDILRMKGSEGHQINLHACQNDTQSSQF